jgi:hypothetical protein
MNSTKALAEIAEQAGIPVPVNPHEYDPGNFPRWFVFVNMQKSVFGIQSTREQIQANAGIIAGIVDHVVMHATPQQLQRLGFK